MPTQPLAIKLSKRLHWLRKDREGMINLSRATINRGMHQKMVFSMYPNRDAIPRMILTIERMPDGYVKDQAERKHN